MQEFASVSSSSYDPAALAAKLTEKSADGWSVVGIVPTGGDVTAFICRPAGSGQADHAVAATPDTSPAPEPVTAEPVAVVPEPTSAPSFEPSPSAVTPEPAGAVVAEPAGWAVSPEPANAPMAPIAESAPATPSYQPAAPTTPAVPAGWYADPAARFELRYWDGSTWTEHVSRGGQQFTDPPVA